MSVLQYPEITEYVLPKKNILVIGCIDLRLTDDLLNFLHFDNLNNRYDIFSLAGTSITTTAGDPKFKKLFIETVLNDFKSFEHWKECLDQHIKIAMALHQIKDIYI